MEDVILKFESVTIVYANGCEAARDVSFEVKAGETLALVGESGCGKTTLVNAALGLLPKNTKIGGSIKLNNTEIVGASEKTLRKVRGIRAGFVAQEPFSAFNPLFSVVDHISEAWRVHRLTPNEKEIFETLDRLGIKNAAQIGRMFPHEWSGGMLQRATITAAEAHQPEIIIADEPTSALDADRANAILTALRASGAALLLVSHDINLVRRSADRIAVCSKGEIVESGLTAQIIDNPKHEATKNLLNTSFGRKNEQTNQPIQAETVLEARNVSKIYGRGAAAVCAVSSAGLTVKKGEIVGICGASGSGKSTLLRLLTTIETPTTGEIFFEKELAASGAADKLLSAKARQGFVMPVFQDPLASLDKNWAIWRIVTEPLTARHRTEKSSRSARREIARKILADINLSEIDLNAKPKQLSIGQCQRISIARTLAANPKLITADEPTASLDAKSAQIVMNLFSRIAERGTAVVIVSHNEPLLKAFCHRVLRMRAGFLTAEDVSSKH